MRAGMEQIFALEVNFSPTEFASKAFRKIKRCWTPAKLFQVIFEFALELGSGKGKIFLDREWARLNRSEVMHSRRD